MKVINLIPGSPEWLKSRSASKAPVIMGDSNYQTRNELLFQMFSGITKEIDARTQARFDNGHRTEALSREIVEEMIGEDLSPVSASDDEGYLTANFDGVTFPYRIGYEHKDWNEKLAASVRAGIVPDSHAWQLDQQILVGKLDYIIFVVSDGTKDNFEKIEYRTTKERTDKLVAAWKQFDIDLANYKHVAEAAAPVAEAIMGLPSVSVQATGMVTASNLPEFKKAADTFIANIKTELVTDEDFVNAEANVKFCKSAEDDLEGAKKAMLAQTSSINEVIQTIDFIKGQLASKRLMLDKLVKSEKENRKLAIISKANAAFAEHVSGLQDEISGVRISLLIKTPDFGLAMKGLKKLSAMQEAVDTLSRDGIYEADQIAKDVRAKLSWMSEYWFNNGGDYKFLFSDLQMLIGMEDMAFMAVIKTRIADHKAAKAAEEEALRIKLQAEATAKAEREAAAKLAEQEARIRAEERAKAEAEQRAAAAQAEEEFKARKATALEQSNKAETKQIGDAIEAAVKPVENVTQIRQDEIQAYPGDQAIIKALQSAYGVSYGTACDWLVETAESLKVAA